MKKYKFKKKISPALCPSPLNIMTLIQYLKDSMDTFQKLELKLTVFEADSYISYLANKYNA